MSFGIVLQGLLPRTDSGISPQNFVKGQTLHVTQNRTSHIWCHTDGHAQWKRVTYPLFLSKAWNWRYRRKYGLSNHRSLKTSIIVRRLRRNTVFPTHCAFWSSCIQVVKGVFTLNFTQMFEDLNAFDQFEVIFYAKYRI